MSDDEQNAVVQASRQPAPKRDRQRPTVGRIVHYYDGGKYPAEDGSNVETLAAIVTGVNEDGSVNLSVFRPGSPMVVACSNVRETGSWEEAPGTWGWPPRA